MKKMLIITGLLAATQVMAAPVKYIVKTKSNVKSLRLEQKSWKGTVRALGSSLGNFHVVEMDERDGQKAVQEISENPDVLYIEKSQQYTFQPVNVEKMVKEVQDAKFSQQWGLKNTGRNSGSIFSPGKKGEDINAEKGWTVTKGSNDIKVAIIDTGIDYNHSDLKDNLLVNEAEKNGVEGVDDDGNGYVDDIYGYDFANKDGDPLDGHGHGTHCAGVIGATHNRTGIRGVMGKVKVFGVKFLTDRGSGSTEDAILSIEYAMKRGANVMSNSWGGGGFSQALKDAIVAANEAGILFVAAAGNSRGNNDSTATYPANYDVENVISVGAMTAKGGKASFSNYGKKMVHVFAPGTRILSTVNNNKYKRMDGTSMACPHVSGAVGLLLSHEPNLTPAEVKARLIKTAVKSSALSEYTVSGRMDVYRMLKNIQN